jgi:hypothetical protein
MVPTDPVTRARLMTEFATGIMPNVINAASIAMSIGVEFNVQRCLTDLAEQQGLSADIMDWFNDPEFMQRMQIRMQLGPQNEGKSGGGGGGQIAQNGSIGGGQTASPEQQFNQNAQQGANDSQAQMGGM